MTINVDPNHLAAMVLFIPACVHGQSAGAEQTSQQNLSKFAGVWRGQFDGLRGVDIVISDEGDQPAGGILFYLHVRPDANAHFTSKPGLPEPIIRMSFEGTTLYFQVSHRRAHPPRTLNDPPVYFRMTMTGPDKAQLANEGERPAVVMIRSDY